MAIGFFRELIEQARTTGAVAEWRDPAFEALWLVSLWDGLQLQWLYAPESVDVAGLLERHLNDLLTAGQ